MTDGQEPTETKNGRVVVGQPLVDRQRPPIRLERLGRLAGLRREKSDLIVADRQLAPEIGDVGVVVGHLLLDHQARRCNFSASAGLPVSVSRKPM